MKLPNGYGSVYKLPGKRRCPYRAIVTERWLLDVETEKSRYEKQSAIMKLKIRHLKHLQSITNHHLI